MELKNLTFILTDRCNFDCSYCYEGKGRDDISPSALPRALDLFRPFFAEECHVSFYGGEPLLRFDLIRQAVEHAQTATSADGCVVKFSLTTNGSLLDDRMLEFLNEHRFSISLSFDGLAQDISRKKGSFDLLVSLIPKILAHPRISLETISVFSADTVWHLSGSLDLLVRLGVPKLDVLFAHIPPWTAAPLARLEEEMDRVADLFLARYQNMRDVPWPALVEEKEKAIHYCSAAVDRMAVSAQGTIWGCAVFPHYLREGHGPTGGRDFCFGDIDTFAKDPGSAYARTIAAYAGLRMDRFSTPERACLWCDEVEYCWVCPLAAGLTTGEIGKIPASSCQRAKIMRRAKERFHERFKARAGRDARKAPG